MWAKNMKKSLGNKINFEISRMVPYLWVMAAAWAIVGTAVLIVSLVWNIARHYQETLQLALHEARTVCNKDLSFYRWAIEHNGIFVPTNEKIQPNPYLAHLPEYSGTSLSGQPLTLINPEYMIRQVYEVHSREHGALGHITSLNPIRPENAADPWERKALKAFERGATEVSSLEEIDGEQYLRLMRPMITEEGCLECHAAQGYKLGDIRGGISVSVPIAPLLAISSSHIVTFWFAHVVLWFFGLSGAFLGTYWVTKSIREREQAEARTRSIIDNMLDGLLTINEDDSIESFNPAASRLFGYEPEEVVGRDVRMLIEVSDGEHEGADSEGYLYIGRGKAIETPYDLTGKRKDGSTFPIETSLSEMRLGGRRLSIAMIRDITERKKAEQALRESQMHIIKQEKLASLGTMVAGIAHEINNPAQAIGFSMEGLRMNIDYARRFVEALKTYLESPDSDAVSEREKLRDLIKELDIDLVLEEIDGVAERNVESIGRIDKIIKSTTRMAHLEENFTACNLNTIISDAVTLTHNQVKYDMKIELDLAPSLPTLQGLAQELGQVFINLIINARDAIREKGLSRDEGRLLISTRYNTQQRRLAASFEDNGVGIRDEIINKIFDPFFTTKTVGQGTGLGLNLCHIIIEAHDGDISVKSRPGKGSCFTVTVNV